MSDKISIVIPCFNEEKYIERGLLSLLGTDYPHNLLEILIVDGGSSDKTLSILNTFLAKYPIISVISNPQRITPVSLNLGIRNATGDYIMIASAHSEFHADYISTLINNLKKLNCDCIGGGIDTRVINSTPVSEAIVKILSSSSGVGNSSFRTEKNSIIPVDTVPFGIYKKSLFDKIGYYNEKLVRNHDIEFSKRLINSGHKIILNSSVRCTYFARETFGRFAANNFANGFWNILTFYITRRLGSLSPRHFVPLIFILSLIIPVVLGLLLNNIFLLVSVFSFMLYFLFILSSSYRMKDKKARFGYILSGLLILHFSYGIGSLTGLLRIDKLFIN